MHDQYQNSSHHHIQQQEATDDTILYITHYHALEQHARVIVTCYTKDIKSVQELMLNSEVERYQGITGFEFLIYIHYIQLAPTSFTHALT